MGASKIPLTRAARLFRAILGANFACLFLVLVATSLWAPKQPSPTAPYPVGFRGQHVRYLPRGLGLYLDIGFAVQIGAIAFALVAGAVVRKYARGDVK